MDHRLKYLFATAMAAALAPWGCTETTSSQNIKTRGIVAIIEVTATSDSRSKVEVTLKVGGRASNTYVDLEGGDRLYASAGDNEKEMVVESAGEYEAVFNTGEEDTEFKIRLERPWDVSAEATEGSLPAPFEIISDFDSTAYSRQDDDVTIEWDPADSNDDMELQVEDDVPSCIFDESFEIAGDPGEFTIEAGELKSTDSDDPGECDLVVKLYRRRNGTVDSKFDSDSRFRLKQVRETQFVSAP